MPIKKISVLFFLICFLANANALPTLKRDLILKGKIRNTKADSIPTATVQVFYSQESYAKLFPVSNTLKVDSAGNYKVELKRFGTYKIVFSASGKIPYTLTCYFTQDQAEQLRKLETFHQFDVTLKNQSKHVKVDIYNGAELNIRSQEVVITPLKKYLQSHDYKYRKGFKKQKRLLKYIAKRIKKQQLEKFLSVMANRDEIDIVIQDKAYDSETRKKWKTYFGKNTLNTDKTRIEDAQKFYAKVTQKDSSNSTIYSFKNYVLDLTKTVMADDTKTVFSLYRFSYNNTNGQVISYDIMLFHTLIGWKVHYISENY